MAFSAFLRGGCRRPWSTSGLAAGGIVLLLEERRRRQRAKSLEARKFVGFSCVTRRRPSAPPAVVLLGAGLRPRLRLCYSARAFGPACGCVTRRGFGPPLRAHLEKGARRDKGRDDRAASAKSVRLFFRSRRASLRSASELR